MIARVQDTTQGFVIVIPPEYVKAWGLRQDFPLEVHKVGSTSEEDSLEAMGERDEMFRTANARTLLENDAAFRELAKGPTGVGPHDPPPFDLRKF